jgi:tetratricopeptide (TPR) repeat protein
MKPTAAILFSLITLSNVALASQTSSDQQTRTNEARQALSAGDFIRAEKLALVVMQNASKEDEPLGAWKVYAECRFRQGGFREAITYFKKAVRPNSDDRVSAMMTISSLSLGDIGGDTFLAHLSVPKYLAKKADVEEAALPDISNGKSNTILAYAWFALAALGKGQMSLDDANMAEKALSGNIAIEWIQGVRLFELGKFKEAKSKFQPVAKSDLKKMAPAAEKRIADCDAKIKGHNESGGLT